MMRFIAANSSTLEGSEWIKFLSLVQVSDTFFFYFYIAKFGVIGKWEWKVLWDSFRHLELLVVLMMLGRKEDADFLH